MAEELLYYNNGLPSLHKPGSKSSSQCVDIYILDFCSFSHSVHYFEKKTWCNEIAGSGTEYKISVTESVHHGHLVLKLAMLVKLQQSDNCII